MDRRIICAAAAAVAVGAGTARAGQVWKSTFDTGPDGVVDIRDGNSAKVMIGPVTSGRLQITTMDNGTDAFTPDKAGRPLGTTVGSNNAFSGLYQFNWSTLNEVESPQAYEMVGFLGNTVPQTRQVLGAILRHWKVGPDYYVGVDLAYESDGSNVGGFGYSSGPSTWLGTNPQASDLQLAVGYSGSDHVLSVGLYDASGAPLIERQATLENILPGTTGEATAIADMALTHLGWEDYSGNLTDQTEVWQNDTLGYFDTFDGARSAVGNLLGKSWAVDADGDWRTASNWQSPGAPDGPGAAATFGPVITAPRTVTVSGTDVTVGALTFDSAQKYTIAGSNAIIINAPSGRSTITVLNGSHEIGVPLSLATGAALTVDVRNAADVLTLSGDMGGAAGTVTKAGPGRFDVRNARAGTLTVSDGTLRVLPSGGAAAGTGRVGDLLVAPGAKLDLTDNKLIVTTPGSIGAWNGSGYEGVTGLIASGRTPAGDWSGSGIVTSLPSTTGKPGLTGIGVATASEVTGVGASETSTWGGLTVTGSDTLVMYTYAGDANLDGKINIDDYGRIDGHVGQNGSVFGWYNGDFNYDGKINIDDYGIIDSNIGTQGTPFPTGPGVIGASTVSAVPEPGGVAAAVAAVACAAGILRPRRRQHVRLGGAG